MTSSFSSTELEDVLSRINEFGKYQKRLFAIVASTFGFGAWICTSTILTASFPQVECKDTEASCKDYCSMPRGAYKYATSSMLVDFDLDCTNQEWKVGFITTSFFIGLMLGSIGLSITSDTTFGRKAVFYHSVILIAISQLLSAVLSFSYWLYIIFHTIAGIGIAGAFISGYVLLIESTGRHYRSFISSSMCIAFCTGVITQSLGGGGFLNYFDWKSLTAIGALPFVLVLLTHGWVVESPYWSIACLDRKLPLEILAAVNGTTNLLDITIDGGGVKHQQHSVWSRDSRLYVTVLAFQWFASGFIYVGLSTITSEYTLVSAGAALLGLVPVIVLCDTSGRQKTLTWYLVIATTAVVTCALFSNARVVLALIGRAVLVPVFSINLLFSVELFPTSIRAQALGTGVLFASIGSVLSLFLSLPIALVFGILFLVLTTRVSSLYLYETLGKPLILLPEKSNVTESTSLL